MIAGGDACPGRQVIDAQEYAHVNADLGDQSLRDQPVDARNLHQESVLRATGLQPLADAQVERGDVRLDVSMAPRFSSKVAPQNSPVWRVGDQPWA